MVIGIFFSLYFSTQSPIENVKRVENTSSSVKNAIDAFMVGQKGFLENNSLAIACPLSLKYRLAFCVEGYHFESLKNFKIETLQKELLAMPPLKAVMAGLVAQTENRTLKLESTSLSAKNWKMFADGWGSGLANSNLEVKDQLINCNKYFGAELSKYCYWGAGRGYFFVSKGKISGANNPREFVLGNYFAYYYTDDRFDELKPAIKKLAQKIKIFYSIDPKDAKKLDSDNCLLTSHPVDCIDSNGNQKAKY